MSGAFDALAFDSAFDIGDQGPPTPDIILPVSKVDVIALVQELCTHQGDPAALDKYFDEVISDLGRKGWLCVAEVLAVTKDTFEYEPPSTVIELWNVIYDDRMLYKENLRAIEAINVNWRDEVGTPRAYVVEDESNKKFRLYPKPDRTSKDLAPVFGSPLGLDYPTYSVVVIISEQRNEIPAWLVMPVAFDILNREFVRESDHQDTTFADACKKLSTMFYAIVSA